MKVYTVNEIVRSALLTAGKPIHYYMHYLHYAKITVDTNREITLPDDYVDYVRVGWENGQYVKRLIEKHSFNRLMHLDSDGNQTAYPDVESDQGLIFTNNNK